MAKEKKEPESKIGQSNYILYEVIGLILLFLGFVTIARLGKLGFYLNLGSRFLFGDWYFLLIIIFMLLGAYFTLMHHHYAISYLKFMGLGLIFLALSILSHFSMHNYIKEYTSNFLKATFFIYVDAFKSKNSSLMIGGGVIGMLFFYFFYYLLSTPGVIILSSVIIIIGVSFVSRRTIRDFIISIKKLWLKFLNILKGLLNRFKKDFNILSKEFASSKYLRLPRGLIDESDAGGIKQVLSPYKDVYEKKILLTLNELNIFHYEVTSHIAPHLIVFKIKSLMNINLGSFETKLVNNINLPFLFKQDLNDNSLIVEFLNPNLNKISLSYIKKNTLNDNNYLLLCVDDRSENVYLNDSMYSTLIFSKTKDVFINYIIQVMYILRKTCFLIDFGKDFEIFKEYLMYDQKVALLDQLILDLEKRLKNQNSNSNIPFYIFINLKNNGSINQDILKKIHYMIEISKEQSIYFIVRLESFVYQNSYFYDLFNYLIDIDQKSKEILKLFLFDNDEGLALGEEGLLKNDDLILRVAIPFLTIKEKEVLEKNMKK